MNITIHEIKQCMHDDDDDDDDDGGDGGDGGDGEDKEDDDVVMAVLTRVTSQVHGK